MREFLYRIEEAEPQVAGADVLQQTEKQWFVIGSDRPRKESPAVAENEMPLPLRWVELVDRNHAARYPSVIQSFAAGNWERPNMRTSP